MELIQAAVSHMASSCIKRILFARRTIGHSAKIVGKGANLNIGTSLDMTIFFVFLNEDSGFVLGRKLRRKIFGGIWERHPLRHR